MTVFRLFGAGTMVALLCLAMKRMSLGSFVLLILLGAGCAADSVPAESGQGRSKSSVDDGTGRKPVVVFGEYRRDNCVPDQASGLLQSASGGRYRRALCETGHPGPSGVECRRMKPEVYRCVVDNVGFFETAPETLALVDGAGPGVTQAWVEARFTEAEKVLYANEDTTASTAQGMPVGVFGKKLVGDDSVVVLGPLWVSDSAALTHEYRNRALSRVSGVDDLLKVVDDLRSMPYFGVIGNGDTAEAFKESGISPALGLLPAIRFGALGFEFVSPIVAVDALTLSSSAGAASGTVSSSEILAQGVKLFAKRVVLGWVSTFVQLLSIPDRRAVDNALAYHVYGPGAVLDDTLPSSDWQSVEQQVAEVSWILAKRQEAAIRVQERMRTLAAQLGISLEGATTLEDVIYRMGQDDSLPNGEDKQGDMIEIARVQALYPSGNVGLGFCQWGYRAILGIGTFVEPNAGEMLLANTFFDVCYPLEQNGQAPLGCAAGTVACYTMANEEFMGALSARDACGRGLIKCVFPASP